MHASNATKEMAISSTPTRGFVRNVKLNTVWTAAIWLPAPHATRKETISLDSSRSPFRRCHLALSSSLFLPFPTHSSFLLFFKFGSNSSSTCGSSTAVHASWNLIFHKLNSIIFKFLFLVKGSLHKTYYIDADSMFPKKEFRTIKKKLNNKIWKSLCPFLEQLITLLPLLTAKLVIIPDTFSWLI